MTQDDNTPIDFNALDLETLAAEQSEIDTLRAERDELRDRFMRALADAENSRKRSERDRREAEQYGGSKLARDLLPVYDNLKRALATTVDTAPESAALIEGVELTLRELTNVMTKHGVAPISPAVGEQFDPQLHQAMFEVEDADQPHGTVNQVLQVGYTLGDRLLRPAMVGVTKAPAKADAGK